MHKKLSFILLLLCGSLITNAQTISETQKLYTTAKVWGFLKYYHPEVAKGKYNWDEELFTIVQKTHTVNNTEDLSKIYLNWIATLGEVKICKSCSKPSDRTHFDKNFDLSWTQNPALFNKELSSSLKYIENNRAQGKSHYFSRGNVDNIVFENEKPDGDWSNENYRLLTLFRYWNQIEYFFPYKYMTDQKWDDVLLEMLPIIRNAATEQQFHLALLELVVKADDAHAGFVSDKTNAYFGFKWAPAAYTFVEGRPVITSYYDELHAKQSDIIIGDIIINVNGKPVSEIVKENWRYINASHDAGKYRNSYYSILNGATDSVNVTIDRNGVQMEKNLSRRFIKDYTAPSETIAPWKMLEGNIGYVHMGILEGKGEVDKMMAAFENTKAIVFDIRNYPNGTLYMIARHLFSEETKFVKFTAPDLDYPGKFYWKSELSAGNLNKNPYKGKIILLVDEKTQSHAEFTAMCFQAARNVSTIGSQTAGADGNISIATFPDKTRSYFTGLGVFYPDGTETQRKGVKIDIEVKPTIEGIRAGRDEVLERAIELINSTSPDSN